MTFWSLHSHSRFSAKDAISDIKAMVTAAKTLGYPALGLTDHGTMAGALQLYTQCRKADIAPLPGIELYFTPDATAKVAASQHLTVAAYTEAGFANLIKLSTMAQRNFFRRPRVDLADLADLSEAGGTEGLLVATGCRSGPVVKTLIARGPTDAARVATGLARYFPLAYIEVMNHGFAAEGHSDDQITDALAAIATHTGLPLIVTADSHYVTPADQQIHNVLKELVTFAEDPADGRFHGTGYHLVDEHWLGQYLEPDVLSVGIAALTELANAASVRIPELDKFQIKIPDVTFGADPDVELAKKVREAYLATGGEWDDEIYQTRIDAELEVIKLTGMAGYLLLVAMFTDWMTEHGIWFQARGSASGSLVCLLLGITQDDPIECSIRMDRFLSGDRTTPPDIDLDIDAERREEVVGWASSRFAVRQVATYTVYGLDETTDEQAGSLRVAYRTTQRKRGQYVKDETPIPDKDWHALQTLARAKVIEKTGTHPAGFIFADSDAELESLPLVRIGAGGAYVTAYDKDDLELMGFPKIDLLGLKTIRAVRIAVHDMLGYRTYQEFSDKVGWDDKATMRRAGSGNTVGMFQLEGYAQRTGLADLNPTATYDIITAQALFRPGVSKEFVNAYMRRRNGNEPIPQTHADIASELADTYGVAIFQEQVVGVLRNLGMTAVDLTAMLKAIKSSGKAGLVKAKEAVAGALPAIAELARGRGWSNDDVLWLEHALYDYGAGYSFGKAHSVRYGRLAYHTAYLAEHHPLEFWTGMLISYTGHKSGRGKKARDSELVYTAAARASGLTIARAHVNYSGMDYAAVNAKTIRRGLVSIKNVGRIASGSIAANAPYENLIDFGRRAATNGSVSGTKDLALGKPVMSLGESTVVRALHSAGALDGLS